ncbi:response regulator transcription factor [Pseudomonas lutea]|uniref:Response regulator transcription factor n=1 Tax=Pseudomonas lutea TaxID=243924 RepID=A0ABR9ACM4_9PSED|nr:response regulator [Pseudomonas lutea]MBD8123639.1 response regulator transcription factor [Pseudomonas lutea]
MPTFTSSKPSLINAQVVFVVDDDEVLRLAVASLLRSVGYNVREFSDPNEMLAHSLAAVAGCLVLDVRLQGYSGFDLQHRLSQSGNRMPIIFITGYGDIPMSVRAMKAGAANFLTKPFRSQELIDAVHDAVAIHEDYVEKQRAIESLRKRFECLTPRERQVMGGVVSGFLNKQIASDLDVSEITVKLHRANMMRKMHVNTIADVVRAGHQLEMS